MNTIMTVRIKIFIVLLVAGLAACESLDTDFESFLDDREIVYPGVPLNVFHRPGNQRLALNWQPSPDQSIVRYTISWNNHRDSVEVEASTHDPADTMTVIIPGLQEYVYNFTIHSYDATGNKSVPLEVENARAYGPLYQASLFNRRPRGEPYTLDENNMPILAFLPGDTIHVATVIEYTNQGGQLVETTLNGEGLTVKLDDYKAGTIVRYRSSYIPVRNAIDTFFVPTYDTFPRILGPIVQLDKALFQEVHLANDVGALSESPLNKLWDGSVGPQGYPNIFHSNGDKQMPHHFTFDLGQVYEGLMRVEETGRNCCHNPVQFEIWGIDDLQGAETTLAGNDPGLKDEAIAKGWTLLQEVLRTDDGSAPFITPLKDSLPPIRYIRIRVLQAANSGENTTNTNMSEITFWRR